MDKSSRELFDGMIMHSIPMYAEVHRLHSSLMRHWIRNSDKNCNFSILDVGAGTGYFFKELSAYLDNEDTLLRSRLRLIAIERNNNNCSKIAQDLQDVVVIEADALSHPVLPFKFDVVCLFYFLQYVSESEKQSMLKWACDQLKIGGHLIIAEKVKVSDTYKDLFESEYTSTALAAGVSHSLIQERNLRFSNAAELSSDSWLESMSYKAGFSDYVETGRWLQFLTAICTK